MTYAQQWRQAAREAMKNGIIWTPTNLPLTVAALKKYFAENGTPY